MNDKDRAKYLAQPLARAANALRFLSAQAVQAANSGHPGMPMGMADVMAVLLDGFVNISPRHPSWFDRDRLVLSAGHGSALLYAAGHVLGYADLSVSQLSRFRQLGSTTPGHPEHGDTGIVDATTGPLGQGLANAVGMAIAERVMAQRYGSELVDHSTYVILGDGCLMEGISHEAMDLAAHLGLGKLIACWDDNGISIDGSTDLATSGDTLRRARSYGWDVHEVDGHDHAAIAAAIEAARGTPAPSLIAARTVIGFGAPSKAGTSGVHGAPLGEGELAAAREAMGWSHAGFELPSDVAAWGRGIGQRGDEAAAGWMARQRSSARGGALGDALAGKLGQEVWAALSDYRKEAAGGSAKATRQSSGEVLSKVIAPASGTIIGGSADLSGSNNTKVAGVQTIQRDSFAGGYIHYGVREHAMAAAMNGMSLHGGIRPYGGTFLVFSDYMRGAMRLSALSELPVTYVLTHDSIGVGEDGPTHQPVEHLAALRAMPNLNVIRPADAVETAEAWELALSSSRTPTALVLTRQALPVVREESSLHGGNLVSRGGYILRGGEGRRAVTLVASGSEVALALSARDSLAASGIAAAVVSMPCWELFDAQSKEYRRSVLGTAPMVGIEAATEMGWSKYLGERGIFVGMSGYGASAPAAALYEHFGITSKQVVAAALRLVQAD